MITKSLAPILIFILFTGCGYKIKQESVYLMNSPYLITQLTKDGLVIESWFDEITINTNDSIKYYRYKEAQKLMKKIRSIDKIKCD